jgi:hypothetical protein
MFEVPETRYAKSGDVNIAYQDAFLQSLSDTDKLALLNALRAGTLFNFTPTS